MPDGTDIPEVAGERDASGTVHPRTLVLVRHAKAEDLGTGPDAERELTERGRRDAAALGAELASGPVPDLVLCSPAARTRATWELVEQQLSDATTVQYEPAVYQASVRTLLGLVRATDASVHRLMVVGHNPGMHDLATLLAAPARPSASYDLSRFPTAATAVLAVPAAWRDLEPGASPVLRVLLPRG